LPREAEPAGGALPKLLHLAAMASLARCGDPIDAPSAFSAERYVCGPEHAAEFEALVEECRTLRQTDVCGGVLSMRGSIDSEDVVMDARVSSATPFDWPGDPGIARTLELLAASPYFNVKLDLQYLAVPPLMSVSGALPENCAAGPLVPDVPCIILNLEARGGNYLSGVNNVVRTMELEGMPEVRASFSGDLARGGYIEGCFHVFVRVTR
jgi:hypothetical protein